MWAWMGAIGVSRYYGLISPSYHTYEQLDADAFSDEFLELLLRSAPYKALYEINSTGITSSRLRLYPENFLNLKFLYPPRDEQNAIIDSLRDTFDDIDTDIDQTRRKIELLREYQTRLIADVVTGKLDVHEAAAKLPDEADEIELLDEADDFFEDPDGLFNDIDAMDTEFKA